MTDSLPAPIIQAITHARALLLRRDMESATRLVQTYGQIWVRLQQQLKTVEDAIAAGRDQQYLKTRVLALAKQVEDEVARYAVYADQEVANQVQASIGQGLGDAAHAVQARLWPHGGAVIQAKWHTLPADAVEMMLGMTGTSSPLYARMTERLGSSVADGVRQGLTEGIALGYNPVKIQNRLRQTLGQGLTWSLSATRTAQLWAYREATRAGYLANGDIVSTWSWHAALDGRTCFPAGTSITTKRGSIAIERVRVGDLVLTHKGRWRKVTETMARPYEGRMVTVVAGGRKVICTEEHPLLVKRQGKLYWIEAADLLLSDHLVCQTKGTSHEVYHRGGQLAIEGSIGESDNLVSSGLQPEALTSISLPNLFELMPIDAINLDDCSEIGNKEVHWPPKPDKGMFLQKTNTKDLQASSGIAFWDGLSSMAAIAAHRTKLFVVSRNGAKDLTTSEAGFHYWGAVTGFGAMMPVLSSGILKNLTAPLTNEILHRGQFALHRAKRESGSHTGTYRERLAAAWACLGDTSSGHPACSGTELDILSVGPGPERLSAMVANKLFQRLRGSARFAMGVFTLVSRIAGMGAKLATALFEPGVGYCKWLSALDTDNVHGAIIAQNAPHVQTVYNLEVDEDHSYVAEGFVAHNCLSCWAKHGTVHLLSEPLNDHWCGRCAAIPNTRSWAELGFEGIPETAAEIEPGEQVFARLDEQTQRQLMGESMWKAWKDDAFQFSDLSTPYQDDVYGEMWTEASLKGILGEKAKDYYGKEKAA